MIKDQGDGSEQPKSRWSAVTSIVRGMLDAMLLNPVALIVLVAVIGVIYLAAIGREIPLVLSLLIALLMGSLSMQAFRRG